MPHSPLRLEAELEQLDTKYAELAAAFMQQLAGRSLSDGTALLCTSKILGAMHIYQPKALPTHRRRENL
jgi:hypothetical protein